MYAQTSKAGSEAAQVKLKLGGLLTWLPLRRTRSLFAKRERHARKWVWNLDLRELLLATCGTHGRRMLEEHMSMCPRAKRVKVCDHLLALLSC